MAVVGTFNFCFCKSFTSKILSDGTVKECTLRTDLPTHYPSVKMQIRPHRLQGRDKHLHTKDTPDPFAAAKDLVYFA